MQHDFQTPRPIDANIRIAAGVLDIVAGDRDTTTVLIEALDGSEASRNAARDTTVEMRDGELRVAGPEWVGLRMFARARLRVVVELPTESGLQVNVSSADVTVRGRCRDIVAQSASGELTLQDATGDVSVKSSSGRVQVGAVGRDCRISTASGSVLVNRVAGKTVVQGVSGKVQIGDVGADTFITTASGDVELGTARSGAANVNTASGSVQIGIAAGTGVWLDLSTAAGRTRSDLPMDSNPSGTESTAALTVKVRTASGDIMLRRAVTV